jgi:4-amino-4-deoxy-L-arabinose transferase-like glycosyltransferase
MSWLTQSRFNFLLIGLTLFGLIGRAFLAPTYFEDYDSLYFARAFKHYSVVDFSPHWPGYPVFIWLAWFANLFTLDPLKSMHAVSVTATGLATVPIALLAKDFALQSNLNPRVAPSGALPAARLAAILAALLWTVVPVTWTDGTEALSDPLAVLFASLSLYATWRAYQTRKPGWYALAGITSGAMLGVRLAYVMLLGPLAWLLWRTWREQARDATMEGAPQPRLNPLLIWPSTTWSSLIGPSTIWLLAGFFTTIAVWFGWQLIQNGSGWFTAGQQILSGHYSNWGESALTDQHPLSRPWRFLETIMALGLGAWRPGLELGRIGLSLAWAVGMILGCRLLWRGPSRQALLLLTVWLLPHVAWMTSSQDIGSSRYVLPIVAAVVILTGIGLSQIGTNFTEVSKPQVRTRSAGRWAALLASLALIIGLPFISLPLALEHHSVPPVEQQALLEIAKSVKLERAVILFDRMLFFTHERYPQVRLIPQRPETFPPMIVGMNRGFGDGVEGMFALRPGFDPTMPPWWKPIVRLCRNPLLRSRAIDWDTAILYRNIDRVEVQPESNIRGNCPLGLNTSTP